MTALGWQLTRDTDADNPVEGDLRIVARRFVRLSSNAESIAQACSVELRWWLAEWFADTSRGTPYLEKLLKRGVDERTVRAVITRVLRRVVGVTRVPSMTVQFDRVRRICRVTDVVVEIKGGSTVDVDGEFGGRAGA
jgi:hypothetical protein